MLRAICFSRRLQCPGVHAPSADAVPTFWYQDYIKMCLQFPQISCRHICTLNEDKREESSSLFAVCYMRVKTLYWTSPEFELVLLSRWFAISSFWDFALFYDVLKIRNDARRRRSHLWSPSLVFTNTISAFHARKHTVIHVVVAVPATNKHVFHAFIFEIVTKIGSPFLSLVDVLTLFNRNINLFHCIWSILRRFDQCSRVIPI